MSRQYFNQDISIFSGGMGGGRLWLLGPCSYTTGANSLAQECPMLGTSDKQ